MSASIQIGNKTKMEQSQFLRVVLYARVSSEEQKEGRTIDAQIAELERFAKEKDWPIVDIYKDEGWSGAALSRPGLDRLRDNASKGIFDAVIVNDVDRLARVAAHFWIIKRDLERQNVKVMFRKLPTETNPTSDLMVNILASFAEFERAMILDRTRRGVRHKVEVKRMFLGCTGPYGYKYVRKDRARNVEGYLEVIPSEAAVIRRIFRWVAEEGLPVRQVMLRLNRLRIPPAKGGKKWTHSPLHRLLRNEIYIGVWYFGKTSQVKRDQAEYNFHQHKWPKKTHRMRPRAEWIRIDLPHLQIVDTRVWQQAQKELNRHRLFNPRRSKHSYLLSGLVRCEACGGAVIGQPQPHCFRYRCASYCGKVKSIREELLDTAVWEAVKSALLNRDLISKFVGAFEDMRKQNRSTAAQAQTDVAELSAAIREEEDRLIAAYRTRKIDADTLGRQLAELSARRANLTSSELQGSERGKPVPSIFFSVDDYVRRFSQITKDIDFVRKRGVLREVIDKVVFDGKVATIHGFIPISGSSAVVANSASMTQEMKDQGLRAPFEITVAVARRSLRTFLKRQ